MASGKSSEYQLAIKIAGKVESSFNSALGAASKRLTALGGLAANAAKVGAAAIAAATTAALAFAKTSVDTGMEFDKSMSQVAATMGTTMDQIQGLRDFALEMGSTTAFSATQAAEALNFMALAGYSATDSMTMLPTVLNLAAAGGMELQRASDMVTDAQSALGLSMEQTAAMVDQMAMASSRSNTNVTQLGDAILTIGATAANCAGGTQELTTVLGALADNGIKGTEGGTHLRNILLALQNPTDKAAKYLNQLGVSVYDADGNMRNSIDIIKDMQSSMDGMSQQAKDTMLSGIFNKTDLASVNALLNTTTERWDELGAAIADSAGAAEQMANTQLDNLAGDITLWNSALEGAQITLSDQLTPTLREFVQFGTDGVTRLTAAFKDGGLEGAMEALGGILSEGLNMVIAMLPTAINAGMQLLGALGQGILDNLPTITSAAVEVAVMFAEGLTQAIPAIFKGGVEIAVQLCNGLAEALPELIPLAMNGIAEIIWAIFDGVFGNFDIGPLLQGITEGFKNSGSGILEAATTLIVNFGKGIAQAAPQIIQVIVDLGLQLIEALTSPDLLTGIIQAALDIGLGLVDGLLQAIPTIIAAIPTIVQNLIDALLEAIPQIIEAGIDLFMALVDNLPAIIQGIAAAIPAIIRGITQALRTAIPQIIDAGVRLLVAITQNLPAIIQGIAAAIPEIILGITEALGEMIPALIEAGIQLFVALVANLPAIIAGIVAAIPEIIQAILGALASLPQALGNIFSGAWEGIKDIFTPAGEFFSGVFSSAWEGIQNIWNAVAGWFDTNVIQPLVNFFAPIVEWISGFFEGCWIIIQAVWQTVATWFDTNVIQPTVTFFSGIVESISAFFSQLWSTIQGIWTAVATWFDTNVVQPLVNFFSPIVESIGGFFSTLWDNICAVWQAAGTWFDTNVATPIKNAFQAVSDFVRGIFNGLIGFVESLLNGIIGGINKFISGFNGIVTKAASVIGVDWSGISEVPTVSLPRLAEGGIATAPTIAQIGEGGEPEVVLPLSKLAVLVKGMTGAGPTAQALQPEEIANAPQVKQLPALATGGIATAPTLAQIGEGAEPEAILPLSKLAGMLQGLVGSTTTQSNRQSAVEISNTAYRNQTQTTSNAANQNVQNQILAIAPEISEIERTGSLPALANGGIATAPTIAQIGEGGEPEVVIPISRLAELLNGPAGSTTFIGGARSAIGGNSSYMRNLALANAVTNIDSWRGGDEAGNAIENRWMQWSSFSNDNRWQSATNTSAWNQPMWSWSLPPMPKRNRYRGIPAMADGGIATAPTIAQVGEAGSEAIVPLSDLWSQMQTIVADAVGGASSTISTLAEQLEAADLGTGSPTVSDLLGQFTGDKAETSGESAAPIQVYYSPTNHYHFDGGNPDREEIAAAEEMSMENFERLMRQYEKNRARTSLRG